MVFHFEHMGLDSDDEDGWWSVREWDLTELKQVIDRWQTGLDDGWHGVYLGNHDQPRIVSRFGDDGGYRRESATMLATLLLTLRGTPFIHQGDELGMTNYPFEAREELADAGTLGRIDEAVAAGRIDGFDDAREIVRYRTRDNARTPMQWDATEHAGFTTGEPWLPVNPDHETVNVEQERGDPDSVLAYYRRLVALRGETPALVSGEYEPVLPDHESVFAYRRTLDGDRLLVLLNFDDRETTVDLSLDGVTRLVGNYDAPADRTVLRPYEARLYRLQE
jgi:glycosidase